VIEATGAGGLADDLESVVVAATGIGKLITVKKAAASGTITVKHNAAIIMATDITLDSEYDMVQFEVIAADTVVRRWHVSNA
jgi:hypothetical protein